MRSDANPIAFAAARAILSAAQPLELDVDGTRVTCTVSRLDAPAWPDFAVPGLDQARDGAWPAPIEIECRWEGGRANLWLSTDCWVSKPYRGLVGLRVRVRPGNRSLVWSTVPTAIGDAEDGTTVSIPGWCVIVKRKKYAIEKLLEGLKSLVARAGLALLSESRVQLFQIDLPSGSVLPSPEAAFRHLVHLALLKLDFLDRGPRAAARGRPLVDVKRFLPDGSTDPADVLGPGDDEEDDEEEPISEATKPIPLNLILYGPPGTGKTHHLLTQLAPRFRGNQEIVTFHQSYSYEDFIEGIRPRLTPSADDTQGIAYRLEDGVFLRAVRAALRLAHFQGTLDEFCRLPKDQRRKLLDGAPPYALFIDEINRGNVARVFGELITLLEDDKRLGAHHEVIVTLPYSRTAFGVPSNLHVIGTMNTADRSVEALDTALRRRFSFQELPPRPDVLDFSIEGQINPASLLRAMNLRLEKLRDRDHCIGHAYLLRLKEEPTLDALKRVFGAAILPLLQEYFFGDWGKIGLVLGRDFVRRRETAPVDLANFPHDDRDSLNDRVVYELVDLAQLTNKSFQRIYQDVPDDA